ncbi:pyruvate, water dikinase regulatory protein [Yimella sp. cx-51]|uniref:pyruvate, water dikinase regulatory protein n=1 Tax=Yimella sp. cx-51 TaxID=2770551 RepID=UPI00165E0FC6|nr:pyruvate, phosphate dikinase/phosphoenolpyruvate synthase regulator [Yimella sp. cx-51]MBC9955895.1 kinase/pyrophosphorylase [Yimella sp. cx-51]MBD2758062.1 kinase/pyrophosphorylase [Yimella sp. cx-573]QTH37562.1 kinase/pyrophosphorylase [Yimella sp. cx-51]
MSLAERAEPTPAYFLAGGTGISAETLGNMILRQFPDVRFVRQKIPFITSVDGAREVVEMLDAAKTESVTPLVFSTVADEAIRAELMRTQCAFIDLFGSQLDVVEEALHREAAHKGGSAHAVRDQTSYDSRMQAVEYAIEHDDGASFRAIEKAEVILLAPSRCGKTPTTMYLALQHSVFVANYPLVPEDLESSKLPRPIAPYADKCFGLVSTAARLSQVRNERRPGSTYASQAQCLYELRRAEAMFRQHRIPFINSSAMSIEEMAAVIMQTLKLNRAH